MVAHNPDLGQSRIKLPSGSKKVRSPAHLAILTLLCRASSTGRPMVGEMVQAWL